VLSSLFALRNFVSSHQKEYVKGRFTVPSP
jgi:hypothetical protein